MIIVYDNPSTKNSIAFEVFSRRDNSEYFTETSDVIVAAKNMIDDAMEQILEFGSRVEFPKILLDKFTDDEEVDIFLMAAFDKGSRAVLESYLYAISTYEYNCSFIEIKTNKYLEIHAIGKDSIIITHDSCDGYIHINRVSFEELESSFTIVYR